MLPSDLNLPSQLNSMNYRQNPIMESTFGGHQSLSTPAGLVHTQNGLQPPPLPPRPQFGGFNNSQSQNMLSGMNGMSSYGSGFGMGGFDGGYGNMYGGSYGGFSGGFGGGNYFGRNMNNYNLMDPETR